jgi:hypothetical protein
MKNTKKIDNGERSSLTGCVVVPFLLFSLLDTILPLLCINGMLGGSGLLDHCLVFVDAKLDIGRSLLTQFPSNTGFALFIGRDASESFP